MSFETEQLHSRPLRRPLYADEAEALIGMPAFYDDERSDLLRDNFDGLDAFTLGARSLLYARSLRVIANGRHEDRAMQREPLPPAEFNDQWRMTYRRMAEIAFSYQESVKGIGRELAMLNNIERYADEALDLSLLMPHQKEFLEEIAAFIQGPSQIIETTNPETGKKVMREIKGATIIAPTGAGKTVIMAQACIALGIGTRPYKKDAPLSLLIVVPSQDLVEQFTGKSGDDTFRRFAPDIPVSGYYQYQKDTSGDVVVTTIDKFVDEFRNGQLNGKRFDVIKIDEVHRLTEDRFYKTLQSEWDGIVMGYTATPDYHPDKDARNLLPYVIQKGDTIPYIENGILNGAQLFTFMVEPMDHADAMPGIDVTDRFVRRKVGREMIDAASVDFAYTQLLEGRRGIIFCEKGGGSAAARNLAIRLSALMIPDGKGGERQVLAEAIGSFRQHANKDTIDHYHAGKLDVLCTTEKGREGLNADFDFVAINCITRSSLKLRQIVGRGTRRSERFPVTRYAQFFIAPSENDPQTLCTISQAFGLDHVYQGFVAGGTHTTQRLNPTIPDIDFLPAHLQEMCRSIHGKKITDLVITPELGGVEIPEGYVLLSEIAAKAGLEEQWAINRLNRGGYAYVGRYETSSDGRIFRRYYEPRASSYFDENPASPLETPGLIRARDLAASWGIAPYTLEVLAKRERIVPRWRTMLKGGREARFFSQDEVERLSKQLDNLPLAGPGDISVGALASELGCSRTLIYSMYQGGGRPVDMRDNKRTRPYVLAADAARFREIYRSIPLATADEFTQYGLAKEIGTPHTNAFRLATKEELSAGQLRRKPDDNRVLMYWPRHVVESIKEKVERRRGGLPAYLLPHNAAALLVNIKPRTMQEKLRQLQKPERLQIDGSANTSVSCFGWDTIRQIQEKYGRQDGAMYIDFGRLPLDEHDTDPAKIAYAQSLQRQLAPDAKLVSYDG